MSQASVAPAVFSTALGETVSSVLNRNRRLTAENELLEQLVRNVSHEERNFASSYWQYLLTRWTSDEHVEAMFRRVATCLQEEGMLLAEQARRRAEPDSEASRSNRLALFKELSSRTPRQFDAIGFALWSEFAKKHPMLFGDPSHARTMEEFSAEISSDEMEAIRHFTESVISNLELSSSLTNLDTGTSSGSNQPAPTRGALAGTRERATYVGSNPSRTLKESIRQFGQPGGMIESQGVSSSMSALSNRSQDFSLEGSAATFSQLNTIGMAIERPLGSTSSEPPLWGPGIQTLYVRNIPARLASAQLLRMWPPQNSYDLLYVPFSHEHRRPIGCALINFISHEAAGAFRERWHGIVLSYSDEARALEVCVATTQGFTSNLLFMKRSKKISTLRNPRYQPVIIGRDGTILDFRQVIDAVSVPHTEIEGD